MPANAVRASVSRGFVIEVIVYAQDVGISCCCTKGQTRRKTGTQSHRPTEPSGLHGSGITEALSLCDL